MNKWQLASTSSAGILILVVFVATLYASDYAKILKEKPDQNIFLLDYSSGAKAEYLIRGNAACPYFLIQADKAYLSVKCKSSNLLVTGTKVGVFTSKWLNLSANSSSRKLTVEDGVIVRTTDYVRSGKKDGTLRESYFLSMQKVKISYDYASLNSLPHRVGWEIKKNVNATLEVDDALFKSHTGRVYWYGEVIGNFSIDPSVVLGAATATNASVTIVPSTTDVIFGYANYSDNATEGNSTFKWFKNSKALIYSDAVGYWHLDENGGTSGYTDSSGNGNTGTPVSGVTNSTGIIRGAATFDGINDYISTTLNPNPTNDSFSVTAWFYRNGTTSGGIAGIVGKRSVGDDWRFYVSNTNIAFQMWNVSNANSCNPVGVTSAVLRAWNFGAAVFNGTHCTVFLNGNSESTVANLGGIQNTGSIIRLGDDKQVAGRFFNGSIDEVAIYNRSLNASEIKQLYLRTWYDYSPQLFLLHPDPDLNASNQSDFNSSDKETYAAVSGAVLQPGRYVDNLSIEGTTNGNVTGYWRFDAGGSTTTANDTSSFGNDGTLFNGVRWVNDSVGGFALQFDGVNDFVNVSRNPSLNITGNLTIQVWARFNEFTKRQTMVSNIRSDGSQGNHHFEFGNTDNKLSFVHGAAIELISSGSITDNNWHHVVVTRNGTVGEWSLKFYIDGVLDNSTVTASNPPPLHGSTVIGRAGDLDSLYFNGTIDEVRILNRSLSANEVLSDYRKAAKGLGLLSNDYINYSATGNFNEREGTIEFWVKPQWNGNDGRAHDFVSLEKNDNDFLIYKESDDELQIYITNTIFMSYGVGDWTAGNWKHVAFTWNNYTSNMTLLVDGLRVNNSGTAFNIPTQNYLALGAQNIGSTPATQCNCTISEFRISRKALTAQEINLTFSKGRLFFQNEIMLNSSSFVGGNRLNFSYAPENTTGGAGTIVNYSVTINAPPQAPSLTFANNSFVSSVNLTWSSSSDSENDTQTITYYATINGTRQCESTDTNCTFTPSAQGLYIWNLTPNDGMENGTVSTTYSFTFDNVTPAIAYILPTEANDSFVNRNYAYVNTSITESGESSAFINFNNSLVGYWRFEDGSGTSAVDTSSYSNTGTLTNFGCTSLNCNLTGGTGGTGSGWTSAGKRGKAIILDGMNDYIDAGGANSIDSITGDLTITAWVKRNGDPGDSEIVSTHQGKTDLTRPYSLIVFSSGATPGLRVGNGTVQFAAQGGTVTNGKWHFLAGTINGTSIRFYLDGVLRGTDTFAGTRQTGIKVVIGASTTGAGDRLFNGSMDEVMIWNRALSETEINASYNAGTYRLFRNFSGLPDANYSFNVTVVDWAGSLFTNETRRVIVDTTLPLISFGLGSDANGSSVARNYIHLNVSVDELNPRNLTAFLFSGAAIIASQNVSANKTPSFNNITFLSVSDGYYNVSVSVRDLADNVNTTSTNRSFTVDTTFPTVEYGINSLLNATNSSSTFIYFNLTVNETDPTNITTFLFNSSGTQLNSSNLTVNTSGFGNFFNYSIPSGRDGNYFFNATVSDLAGNRNTSITRTIRTDMIAPQINITYPLNGTISGSNDGNESISLNFTWSDFSSLAACTYLILNSSGGVEKANTTISGCSNTTFNISAFRTYTLKLYINDTYGNMNETSKAFKVDVTSLNLSFGPANLSKFTWLGCGTNISNSTAQPANQTAAKGIDYVCNNGTASANVEVKLNMTPAAGWQIFASNSSLYYNFTNLTNASAYKIIYKDLPVNSCFYVWYNASCNNVSTGPQTYEVYRGRRD